MAQRAGTANLPLHGGQVPKWLADRMTRLGAVISEAIVHHYGRDELLRRLAHPFWFQSFGGVMGMGWHSSGITTSVIGALKRGLGPLEREPASMSAVDAANIPDRPRTSSSRSVSGLDSMAPTLPQPADWLQRSTVPPSRMGSSCICTALSSQTTVIGPSFSRSLSV
jgi:hypothetical protein